MLEKDLATAMGLTVTALRKWRREYLIEGEDWGIEKRSVFYSEAGKAKMARIVEKSLNGVGEGEESATVEIAPPETPSEPQQVVLWVIRLVKNPRILLCAQEPRGEPTERVKVRSNQNFIPGMELKALTTGQPHLWTLGQRCPRWRGRW